MLPQKVCPICKKKIIAGWESACQSCWNKVIEHDLCPICRGACTIPEEEINGNHYTKAVKCPECNGTGYTGEWHKNLIIFNHGREVCRKAGFDPIIRMPF